VSRDDAAPLPGGGPLSGPLRALRNARTAEHWQHAVPGMGPRADVGRVPVGDSHSGGVRKCELSSRARCLMNGAT
jgi:hypothetical protein